MKRPSLRLPPKVVLKAISYWPPFLASGIKVERVADDLSEVVVSLTTHPWNKNYFGTHFGGSLYAMCDPFLLFLLVEKLGKEYIVWDRAADITFLKAVSEPVYATFAVAPEKLADIRTQANAQFKVEPVFEVDVVTASGEVVAKVGKTLYVRRKDAKTRFAWSRKPNAGADAP